jgi:hypothetical protein
MQQAERHHSQDLLVYIDKLETDLRGENERLSKELVDAQLDLDDARRSRREMQQQLSLTSQQLGQYNTDNETLKVLQAHFHNCDHWLTRIEPKSIRNCVN